MVTLLLIIIYLAFISLGLPDSLLGAAWPAMQLDFEAPIDTAGYLFMVIAAGTIISSLASGHVLKLFGTGKVTLVSAGMTAIALLGFHFAPSLIWLVVFAIPLGLGAGAIDTGLNDYVARHYKAHHMSWLHSFWGVGATLGPIVMAYFMQEHDSWRNGYLTISIIQFSLVLILFISLPLWGKAARQHPPVEQEQGKEQANEGTETKSIRNKKGVKWALFSFFFYCAAEATVGLWGSSYLVNMKALSPSVAAKWISFYWAGITIGRFITGFITLKVNNNQLIRAGQMIALSGAVLLLLPLPSGFALVGLLLIGLGLAPIFPCMLHETPVRFGTSHSQKIMGYQMATAYTGTTFMPPLFGFIAAYTSVALFPVFIVGFIAIMWLTSERLQRILKQE
ncbi:MFS transporter [Gracilibacillus alcaliphilus]|uniref:MFS transporter n=1 Tax=Gracilibacillus alcaliphilus TaxID=1401441 RepID=UPI0019577A74|nr:MFS transporter [Gracilibacillus alcaliphilus]MBM7676304.1 fucose permease [Gracilibacillus alcaliphilus]